jgi:hypothetical protein
MKLIGDVGGGMLTKLVQVVFALANGSTFM